MRYKLVINNIDDKVCISIKKISIRDQNNVFELMATSQIGLIIKLVSPTLFSIFINDLVHEINKLDVGIKLVNRKPSMLLYADDITLKAKSTED